MLEAGGRFERVGGANYNCRLQWLLEHFRDLLDEGAGVTLDADDRVFAVQAAAEELADRVPADLHVRRGASDRDDWKLIVIGEARHFIGQ